MWVTYVIALLLSRVKWAYITGVASRRVALRADYSLAKTRRIDASIAAASPAPRFGAASAEQLARDCQRLLIVRFERRGPIQSLQRKRVPGASRELRPLPLATGTRFELKRSSLETIMRPIMLPINLTYILFSHLLFFILCFLQISRRW